MTQAQIDRAVAHITGETVEFVHKMGFGILQLSPPNPPPPRRGGRRKSRSFRRRRRCFIARTVQLKSVA